MSDEKRPTDCRWDEDEEGPDPDASMRGYERFYFRAMAASEPAPWNRPRPPVSRSMRARLRLPRRR